MFRVGKQVGDLSRRAAQIEHEVVAKIRRGEHVARDVHAQHEATESFGERLADRLADLAGSWPFLIGFFSIMGFWVALNVGFLFSPWDKYPFILLNLMLSMLAAVQAPVIMMSQNRQESRDRLRSENDYEVNLKSEIEIRDLHVKLDQLRQTLDTLVARLDEPRPDPS